VDTSITVKHCTHLLDAPPMVVALALEAMAVIQRERAHVLDFLTGEELVLWTGIDGTPDAVQIVAKAQKGRVWIIRFHYILPDHRGKGITVAIRSALRALAVADPVCRGIEWRTRADNAANVRALEREGHTPNSFMYRTDVDALRRAVGGKGPKIAAQPRSGAPEYAADAVPQHDDQAKEIL